MIASAPRPHCSPRAFVLIEMVAMVTLLAVFMLVGGELFKATYLSHRNATRRDDLDLRVDAAIAMLRRDVWAAHAITAADGEVTLTLDVHTAVRWQFGSIWTRTQTGDSPAVNTWRNMPADTVHADARGPLLTLRFGGVGGEGLGVRTPSETITFVSQAMAGGRQ